MNFTNLCYRFFFKKYHQQILAYLDCDTAQSLASYLTRLKQKYTAAQIKALVNHMDAEYRFPLCYAKSIAAIDILCAEGANIYQNTKSNLLKMKQEQEDRYGEYPHKKPKHFVALDPDTGTNLIEAQLNRPEIAVYLLKTIFTNYTDSSDYGKEIDFSNFESREDLGYRSSLLLSQHLNDDYLSLAQYWINHQSLAERKNIRSLEPLYKQAFITNSIGLYQLIIEQFKLYVSELHKTSAYSERVRNEVEFWCDMLVRDAQEKEDFITTLIEQINDIYLLNIFHYQFQHYDPTAGVFFYISKTAGEKLERLKKIEAERQLITEALPPILLSVNKDNDNKDSNIKLKNKIKI